jgi:hypothetical protein
VCPVDGRENPNEVPFGGDLEDYFLTGRRAERFLHAAAHDDPEILRRSSSTADDRRTAGKIMDFNPLGQLAKPLLA